MIDIRAAGGIKAGMGIVMHSPDFSYCDITGEKIIQSNKECIIEICVDFRMCKEIRRMHPRIRTTTSHDRYIGAKDPTHAVLDDFLDTGGIGLLLPTRVGIAIIHQL